MSQTPEQFYLILKISETNSKICDLQQKMLEIISRDKEPTTADLLNLQNQAGKVVIESLNLFQDKAYIETILGDKIMNQGKQENIEISIGNNAQFSGDFVVAKSIENSFNKVANSDLENELKNLLKELSVEVGKMMEHLPQKEGKDVKEDLETLIDKTTCENPKRKYWSVSIDGLTKAAENLGKLGVPVLELVGKIVPFLIKISV